MNTNIYNIYDFRLLLIHGDKRKARLLTIVSVDGALITLMWDQSPRRYNCYLGSGASAERPTGETRTRDAALRSEKKQASQAS
jgi:hypothetical protein